ncbi:MAG: hypothetical protein NTX61_07445 [Bacteroidetes bacterium]|nr:hypothetical protein [Bacteroidota bacterium]
MIKDNYLYSTVYSSLNEFLPENNCTYFYGHSTEGRSYIAEDLISKYSHFVRFVEIKEIAHDIILDISSNTEYNLRSSDSMKGFLSPYKSSLIYIDSSGLNNRICAALLKNAYKCFKQLKFKDIKIIYAEPATYKVIQFSTEGIFNDLSERIEGIEPLPGFSSIIPYGSKDTFFIALLGFEGGRFKYILENIQPTKGTIYPVIGVPGFRAEYPFVAYWGNRRPLDDKDIWCNIKYAAANSIVDIYTLLAKMLKSSPSGRLKIAPIGTKPHAIGAILFAIKHPLKVELIYDNPKRVKKRTDGVGKIIECSVYKLLKEK